MALILLALGGPISASAGFVPRFSINGGTDARGVSSSACSECASCGETLQECDRKSAEAPRFD